MIKKDINQNDILNSELLNIIDYNYIFDENPIKRIKTKPTLELMFKFIRYYFTCHSSSISYRFSIFFHFISPVF